jgi:hypothetical protein
MLLNQPGSAPFGADGSGMNITLTDTASQNYGSIQNAGDGYLTGTFNATGTLSTFNGSQANGTWTLFFADMNSGGGTSTLNSWSLNITAVPEPVTIALSTFGMMMLALAGLKWTWGKTNQGGSDGEMDGD